MLRICLLCLCWLIAMSIVLAAGEDQLYRLAAKDRITVTVQKHEELSGSFAIPPDGIIDFPRVGRVNVMGMSLAEVAAALRTKLGETMRDPQVSVVLAEIHTQNAYVLGAVKLPGQYPLAAGARITELLAAAGDLIGDRAKHTATLVRGKETMPVDLQRALAGNPTANIALQEGDVLWVQEPATITVIASGQVKTPGALKLPVQSTLLDLLAAAGGLAAERDTLVANLVRGGKTTIPLDLQAALGKNEPAANPALQEGDVLWVQERPRMTVVVSGQVKAPGAVKLQTGATLVDALAAAGDVTDRPERAKITLMRGGQSETLAWGDATKKLAEGDVILVAREAVARVYINGHIKNPGAYELPEGGGVLEAIALAGGVLANPALAQVTIVRADGKSERVDLTAAMRDGTVERNPKLAGGDQIIVPQSTAKISVFGMVRAAGTFFIDPGTPMTVTDAIAMAGGQNDRARLSEVRVIRKTDGQPQVIQVDVIDILKKNKQELNITLQANDIVFVPESTKFDLGSILGIVGAIF